MKDVTAEKLLLGLSKVREVYYQNSQASFCDHSLALFIIIIIIIIIFTMCPSVYQLASQLGLALRLITNHSKNSIINNQSFHCDQFL